MDYFHSILFIFSLELFRQGNKCFDDNTTNNLDLLNKKLTKVEKILKENNVIVKREVFNGTTRSFDSTVSNGGDPLKCNKTEEIDRYKTNESRNLYRNIINATNRNLSNSHSFKYLFSGKDHKSFDDLISITRKRNNSENFDKAVREKLELNPDDNGKERIGNNVTGNAEIMASDVKLENSKKNINELDSEQGNSNKEPRFRRYKNVQENNFQNYDERNGISIRFDPRIGSLFRKHHNGVKIMYSSANRYNTTFENILFNLKSNNKKEKSFRELKNRPNFDGEFFVITKKYDENRTQRSKDITPQIFFESSTKSLLNYQGYLQLRNYTIMKNSKDVTNVTDVTLLNSSVGINKPENRSKTFEQTMNEIQKAMFLLYAKKFEMGLTSAASKTSSTFNHVSHTLNTSHVQSTTIKYKIWKLNKLDQKKRSNMFNESVTGLGSDQIEVNLKPLGFRASDIVTTTGSSNSTEYEYIDMKYWKIIIIPVVATIFSIIVFFGMVYLCWKCCCVPVLKNIENSNNNCNCQTCS